MPDELPVRGPQGPTAPNSATDGSRNDATHVETSFAALLSEHAMNKPTYNSLLE